MNRREANYDLLRVICAVAVIFIHIANSFLKASFEINYQNYGFVFAGSLPATVILDTLPRFAVQCFVMLSGAFLLGNKRNVNFKYFYSRSFRNIGVTTLVFSVAYTLYASAKRIISGGGYELLIPLLQMVLGLPDRHMWFMFMLPGLYLMTPVLLVVEERIKPADLFGKITWVFLAVSVVSYWSRPYDFAVGWDIGLQAEFLSLFMAGYSIRRWAECTGRSNVKGTLLIASGLFTEMLLAILRYREMLAGKSFTGTRQPFDWLAFEGMAPFVMVSAVLIFAGFALLEIHADFSRLSSLTFLIYLFHIGIWDIMGTLSIHLKLYPPQTAAIIPVCAAVVFVLSLLGAWIYRWLWNNVEKKFKITDRLCRLLRLV